MAGDEWLCFLRFSRITHYWIRWARSTELLGQVRALFYVLRTAIVLDAMRRFFQRKHTATPALRDVCRPCCWLNGRVNSTWAAGRSITLQPRPCCQVAFSLRTVDFVRFQTADQTGTRPPHPRDHGFLTSGRPTPECLIKRNGTSFNSQQPG